MKEQLIQFYLDWTNNHLTVQKFADYHGFDIGLAEHLLEIGRLLHLKEDHLFNYSTTYHSA